MLLSSSWARPMNKALLRSVARGLRYRPLEQLIGRSVWIRDLADVETAIRSALRTDMPPDCRLIDSEPHFREGAIAKYGILDLTFSAPAGLLGENSQTGIPLLRDLGFLPRTKGDRTDNVCHDPICLEMLEENLGERQAYLLLFLREGG